MAPVAPAGFLGTLWVNVGREEPHVLSNSVSRSAGGQSVPEANAAPKALRVTPDLPGSHRRLIRSPNRYGTKSVEFSPAGLSGIGSPTSPALTTEDSADLRTGHAEARSDLPLGQRSVGGQRTDVLNLSWPKLSVPDKLAMLFGRHRLEVVGVDAPLVSATVVELHLGG